MINTQIQTGKARGMTTMDNSLQDLVRAGIVTPEQALDRALDKDLFRQFTEKLASSPALPAAAASPTPSRPAS